MRTESVRKITPDHLQRTAYLYIRQSTLRQVAENQESTRRQYDLRERAVALGDCHGGAGHREPNGLKQYIGPKHRPAILPGATA